jgi:hypothetical protein
MVYAKNKSGDPDYDDKHPIEAHSGGKIVKGPDGRDVLMSEVVGPVDLYTGEHVNMDVSPEDLDNRPAPGEVATEASSVQTYTQDDTPTALRTDDEDAVQPAPAVGDSDAAVKPAAKPGPVKRAPGK